MALSGMPGCDAPRTSTRPNVIVTKGCGARRYGPEDTRKPSSQPPRNYRHEGPI